MLGGISFDAIGHLSARNCNACEKWSDAEEMKKVQPTFILRIASGDEVITKIEKHRNAELARCGDKLHYRPIETLDDDDSVNA
jgi:hypothetical protein